MPIVDFSYGYVRGIVRRTISEVDSEFSNKLVDADPECQMMSDFEIGQFTKNWRYFF